MSLVLKQREIYVGQSSFKQVSQAKNSGGYLKTFVLGRTMNPKFGMSFRASQSRYFNYRQNVAVILSQGDFQVRLKRRHYNNLTD